MKAKKVSIGVLGTAKILPTAIIAPAKKMKNVQIFGIASRNKKKAKEFASEYSIPCVFSNYESLVRSKKIDVVYIPLPNDLHTDWALKSAKAKKHILIEKPICISLEDFDIIESATLEHGVHLLEAIMVQHHPWQKKVKEIIDRNEYGKLQLIKTKITFNIEKNIENYRFNPEKGGGVFYDVGTYWIQFVNNCIGLQPNSIKACSLFNGPNGIDSVFEAWMHFPNDVHTELFCSFEHPFEATHWLEFEKAKIRIRNFLGPAFGDFKLNIDIHFKETNQKTKISFLPNNYYYNQLDFFIQVLSGKKFNIPLSNSRKILKIMEELYIYAKKNNY